MCECFSLELLHGFSSVVRGLLRIACTRVWTCTCAQCGLYAVAVIDPVCHRCYLFTVVLLLQVRDHFIFSVETTGALPPEDIFREAVKVCH